MNNFYKTVPIFKTAIWGGENLKKIGKKAPEGIISESWELCTLSGNENKVINYEHRENLITDIIKEHGKSFFGGISDKNMINNKDVPFLLKLIDANNSLSIQVHPDDEYAKENENGELGKTEMWYIIDAKPDANIIFGFNENLKKEEIINVIKNKEDKDIYKRVPVKKGDVIFVPSGTVHSLNDGLIVAEIQEQSDLTYRIFDYNRKDKDGNTRELHVEKALDVISFDNKKAIYSGITLKKENFDVRYLALSKYFCVREFTVNNAEINVTTCNNLHTNMLINGHAYFKHNNEILNVDKLETIIIPADTRHFTVYGKFTLLDIFMPINDSIYTPLLDAGYSMDDIHESIGGTI